MPTTSYSPASANRACRHSRRALPVMAGHGLLCAQLLTACHSTRTATTTQATHTTAATTDYAAQLIDFVFDVVTRPTATPSTTREAAAPDGAPLASPSTAHVPRPCAPPVQSGAHHPRTVTVRGRIIANAFRDTRTDTHATDTAFTQAHTATRPAVPAVPAHRVALSVSAAVILAFIILCLFVRLCRKH